MTTATTIAAPGIVIQSGACLHYVPLCRGSYTHSVTVAGNMATNLNQIDKDLKALAAALTGDEKNPGVNGRLAAIEERLHGVEVDMNRIEEKLDEVIGGPSDDEQQAKVDELTAKLKEQEEKLKAVLSPDQ